ncbi:MAG: histidine phosphatase family protein [Pseudomonadota bacterium]
MIFLVRHGEAAASWGEHDDPGLSDTGRDQAERAALELMALGAHQSVTSPMRRCRETAEAFEDLAGLSSRVENAVSEIKTPDGVADRVSWLREVMAGDWPADLADWRSRAFDAIANLPDGTAVFSHFVAINAIVGSLTSDPRVLVFKPGHCSVTQLRRGADSKLSVEAMGSEAVTRVL